MKTITISEKQGRKKISRVLTEIFPDMPVNAMYKAFRKKDIKVNGVRVKDDLILNAGDVLEVYITDAILDGVPQDTDSDTKKGLSIIYEDKNILIVNKEQGISVHPDREHKSGGTLIDLVQEYLIKKGEFSELNTNSFKPSLCHRLDRNTGGLIIIAKNSDSLNIILNKIRNREIKKYYLCLVKGKMEKDKAELRAFLVKDDRKSKVFVDSVKTRDSLEIITKYKVLSYNNDISKLEVELVTGRTHQIRAHLAYIGHPIIGDGKYGTNAINRPLGLKYQALWAYKIVFEFRDESGMLKYLNGKTFEVEPEFPF